MEAVTKLFFRWGVDGSFMRFWYDCEDDRARQRLASTLFFFLLAVNGLLLGPRSPLRAVAVQRGSAHPATRSPCSSCC